LGHITEALFLMVRDPPDAILMVSDELTFLNRRRVYEFAAEHRVPATYERANYVHDGGLSSYSPDLDEIYDRATYLADNRRLSDVRAHHSNRGALIWQFGRTYWCNFSNCWKI
jgi:hypothetical protein